MATARWRLTWFVIFNIAVLTVLVARGESGPRALVQGVAVALLGTLFAIRVWWENVALRAVSFCVSVVAYFAILATTGGLASPLLMTSAVTIAAAAVTLREPPWLRGAVFVSFLSCFVALALLSRTSLARLASPLQPSGAWASPEFVCLALLAALYTMMGVYRMGCHMTRGYERAALELAERREEICSESEDRTKALEGVAARLAHEVKNPLAAIKALSTHMSRNATDAKTAERLTIVANEADRLQAIVDGFLSFSRGLDELKLAPTKPYEVARELAVLLETRAEDAGVVIEVVGDESVTVHADVRKLRQALLNVVLNAIQASPRGSIVKVRIRRDGGGALVSVEDTGAGMSPEVLDRIRKPYFTTKEGGTGLGVAVARGLVEQHGGGLEFKSVVGKGTTAAIRLPADVTPCTRLPNPSRAAKPESGDVPETRAARVLTT
ncbi:MAG: HAMP domain-containing sensor histidine kinase [Polyangiaceae bacterium]